MNNQILSEDNFHEYQERAMWHSLYNETPMLWLEMGLGKTIVALSTVSRLLQAMHIRGVLVVAPLRVCQTVWRQEALKWNQTHWLKFSLITGDKDQRVRAARAQANVYLVNYDNLAWLMDYLTDAFLKRGLPLPFDMVIYDEISKLKNTRTRQGIETGKAALKLLPYTTRRMGLTGTPSSNGLLDLFGQYLVLDGGARFGTSFTSFKQNYFIQHRASRSVHVSNSYFSPGFGAEEQIKHLIGDITLSMKAEDYLDMPDKIINDVMLELPSSLRERYEDIERQMLVELESGAAVDVFNEASLINRCLQFVNGAIYTTPGQPEWERIHDVKLDALEDIVEEAAGEPVLVAFEFQHDFHRIKRRFKDAVWFSAKMSEEEAIQAIDDFQNGRIRILAGHPGSLGHGLDRLQHASNQVVFFGLPWSADLYQQTLARLWRQGQLRPVFVHRILVANTTDEAVKLSLERKAESETSIKNAVRDYWRAKQNQRSIQHANV